MKYRNAIYVLYGLLIIYIGSAILTLTISAPSVVWDAGLCLKMTDNGYKHIPFNCYAHPDPAKISQDQYEFVTWWSPGQFVLPEVIEKAFNLKLSVSLKILTLLCMAISLVGISRLYKQLLRNHNSGISNERLTALGLTLLLFTVVQPFFWGNLDQYDGGGILMLAYCPWFIYFTLRFNRINVYTFFWILAAGFAGFFLKSAFICVLMAALFYLFLENSIPKTNAFKKEDVKKVVKNGIYTASILLIYILVVKVFFLSHNRGISNSAGLIRIQPRVLLYPLVAPLLNLLALSFVNRTYQWIIAAVFIVPLYYYFFKTTAITANYRRVLVSFLAIYFIFYFFLYLFNLDVSYELRHYTFITILITPAMFLGLRQWRTPHYIIYSLLALCFGVNLFNYVKSIVSTFRMKQPNYLNNGLPSNYSASFLKEIDSLDNLKHNGKDIFCFPDDDPLLALEVRNNRVLLDQNFLNFHFDNSKRFKQPSYHGLNSGKLYLVCSIPTIEHDSALYVKEFENYKVLHKIYHDEKVAIFEAFSPAGAN